MKALVGAFNQEKALVGVFSVIVKTDCETDGALQSTSLVKPSPNVIRWRHHEPWLQPGVWWLLGPTPDRRQFCEMTRPWKLRLSNITFLVWAVFVVPTFHFLFLLLFTSSFFLWCAHYIQMFHVTFIGDLSTKPNLNLCLTFNVFPLNFNCVIRIKDDS